MYFSSMMRFMEPSRIGAHNPIKSCRPPLSAWFSSVLEESEVLKTEANLFSIKGDGDMEKFWGGRMAFGQCLDSDIFSDWITIAPLSIQS